MGFPVSQTQTVTNHPKSDLSHDTMITWNNYEKRKEKEKTLKSSATWMEEIPMVSWPACKTFAQLPYGTCTNLSALLHQSASNCCHFSWSRQKQRRQHVGERMWLKLAQWSWLRNLPLKWNNVRTHFAAFASRFGVPLSNTAERPRTETQELLGYQSVRILLEHPSWKWWLEFPLWWCCSMLNRPINLRLLVLWASLVFPSLLSLFRHGHLKE